MSNVLVMNVTGRESRVALVEDGVLAELYIERQAERSIVGNIYKGRVVRVLPGMQAAFVDIGTDKAGFLYVSDVLNEHHPVSLDEDGDGRVANDDEPDLSTLEEDNGDDPDSEGNGNGGNKRRGRRPNKRKRKTREPIETLLSEGQEILVQTVKQPIGTKGARLTCHITLPGRHLVFMPTVDHIGISRRITSERERLRLRRLIDDIRPEGSGFIVRTAAESEPSAHLRQDLGLLVRLWSDVLKRRDKVKAPALLHEDLDLILRSTRDLVTNNVAEIIVDSPAVYERIPEFIRTYMPGFACNISLYTGRESIFDAFGIEIEIQRALKRKVWLPSGAYLIIDQTEAMATIDVNTGRYVGKSSLEETITKINLEAVDEVIYQLRLRDIGGLIVIDFIDMESRDNREKVRIALASALAKDKTRTNVLDFSEFGLVEMTRKRVKENLFQQLFDECVCCEGRGRVQSRTTTAYQLLRRLSSRDFNGASEIEVSAHPTVCEYLKRYERASLDQVETRAQARIHLRPRPQNRMDDFRIEAKRSS